MIGSVFSSILFYQDFIDYDELPEEMVDEMDSGKLSTAPKDLKYRPVYYHWFYQTQEDPTKAQWTPFSMKDSMALDEAFNSPNQTDVLVPTDGRRFDVNVTERKRVSIYWKGQPNSVRRCSWFYKALDSRFVPYEEEIAEKLEEEYRQAAMSGEWHKKIPLQNGETVVFHGPSVIVHFLQSQNPDSWGSTAVSKTQLSLSSTYSDDIMSKSFISATHQSAPCRKTWHRRFQY